MQRRQFHALCALHKSFLSSSVFCSSVFLEEITRKFPRFLHQVNPSEIGLNTQHRRYTLRCVVLCCCGLRASSVLHLQSGRFFLCVIFRSPLTRLERASRRSSYLIQQTEPRRALCYFCLIIFKVPFVCACVCVALLLTFNQGET